MFAVISHETEADFHWFFMTFISAISTLGYYFSPKYIMMDACDASYNVVRKMFPNTTIDVFFTRKV